MNMLLQNTAESFFFQTAERRRNLRQDETEEGRTRAYSEAKEDNDEKTANSS